MKTLMNMMKNIYDKNYDEDSDKGCMLKVDIDYLKELYNLCSDLPFQP